MRSNSGFLVTAAFIGPGTVTTASMAGANFGYQLLWAVLFSVIATLILQEMAARIGLVTGKGLAETMVARFSTRTARWLTAGLIVAAIGIGNSAYQAGNLTGSALGISQLLGGSLELWAITLGLVAGVLMWTGNGQLLTRVLIALVLVMSLVFILTFALTSPDWGKILQGLQPSFSDASITTVIALIGTTVVPYNLFLQASVEASNHTAGEVKNKLSSQRKQALMSIGLGGLITLAILGSAAGAFFHTGIQLTAGNIAAQLQPVLGDFASLFFAMGLFAAGLTSAITAPMAAAFAVGGACGWSADMKSRGFRWVWVIVLAAGILFASIGVKPLLAILFAQATNGLLLPVVAVFLLLVMNDRRQLGEFCNRPMHNIAGGLVVLVVAMLGLYKLVSLFV